MPAPVPWPRHRARPRPSVGPCAMPTSPRSNTRAPRPSAVPQTRLGRDSGPPSGMPGAPPAACLQACVGPGIAPGHVPFVSPVRLRRAPRPHGPGFARLPLAPVPALGCSVVPSPFCLRALFHQINNCAPGRFARSWLAFRQSAIARPFISLQSMACLIRLITACAVIFSIPLNAFCFRGIACMHLASAGNIYIIGNF